MAKDEIRPHTEALDVSQVARHPPDEALARLLAEGLVEVDEQQRICPSASIARSFRGSE
jgi:hypothetical protein